ncbi:hypothetical protein QA597_10515 [Marinilabiliaceae bacterium ANBcel2]|nr:hypothetical protein [Marinilabiliaceae bacterium ANBcel2]
MKIFNLLLAALTIVFFVSCDKDDDSSLNSGSDAVVDADGNIYQTVTIGNQIWMAENLRTTKYNNGSPI